MSEDIVIGMAGSGGDGVVAAGESLMTAAALAGYHAMMAKSFGPQIRGGESSCRIRISRHEVRSLGATLDVAIALRWEDFLAFGAELPVGERTVLVYDVSARALTPGDIPFMPAEVVAAPIGEMARLAAGTDQAKNIVVLGLLAGWFGIARDAIQRGIGRKFARKSAEVRAANDRAFSAGVAWAETHPLRTRCVVPPPADERGPRLLADGNDMCAAAAVFAGCELFAGYPITPSSEIMQFLERELPKVGGTMLQAEDEIASIGAVVGASFAGKKAMTATSGPGMSLKTEMLGLASIAELPLVCVNVQRGGPATGLPTKSEQADLFQAIFSAHGDAVRPVLAPTDVRDTFAVTVEAFNIAEEYQTPVILLSDQEIAQRKEVFAPIDTATVRLVERRRPTADDLARYARFRDTESGVSPISEPGVAGGTYLAAGIEHDEHGAPTANGEIHARMVEKRLRKLAPLARRRDLFLLEGDGDASIGLVAWGSVAGVAREALAVARAEGFRVKLLVPKLLYPVAEDVYRDFFASVRAGVVIEQSRQGQLYRVLRMHVAIPEGVRSLGKSGANPIGVNEVVEHVRRMVT